MLDEIMRIARGLCPKIEKWGFTQENLVVNINHQVQGWSLLHLIAYRFDNIIQSLRTVASTIHTVNFFTPHPQLKAPTAEEIQQKSDTAKQNLLKLVQLLIAQGADVNLEDNFKRTPICFASATEIANLLVENGALEIEFSEKGFSPLHVLSSQMMFSIEPLLAQGLNIYFKDHHQRLAIHYAAVQLGPMTLQNIQLFLVWDSLIHNKLLSTPDAFNHYPLSYALVYAEEKTIDLLLAQTPIITVLDILKRIGDLPLDNNHEDVQHFTELVKLNDKCYKVPVVFHIVFGAGRDKGVSRQAVIDKLKAVVDDVIYEYRGKIYYLKADGHEPKHLRLSNSITKPMLKEWNNSETPATFNPDSKEKYYQMLREAIKCWCHHDCNSVFIDMGEFIGWDEGQETNIVELYYNEKLGSHIRPKREDKIKTEIIIFENSQVPSALV